MKRIMIIGIALAIYVSLIPIAFAAEHGGKEHGGTAAGAQGGVSVKAPSANDIRTAMGNHVSKESKATGTFDISDPETGKVRHLKLERIHERVGKTGNYHYSCADFKDTVSGEDLDLDLDVQDNNGSLNVVDARIHKVNGKERYTYDKDDNRIPVPAKSEEHEHGKEHGGKEHGGR